MTDNDKVNLVYRYFFYNEVKYRNRVNSLKNTFDKKHYFADDLFSLYLAQHDEEFFNQIMTEVLSLLGNSYFK